VGPVVTDSVLREAALNFASRGWPVLPVAKTKVPLTRHGYKDGTRDATVIRDYWEKWPDANVGIVTGAPSGIVVIDIDGPDGEDSLKALEGIYGPLPPTLEARTGRGRHLYYKTNMMRCPTGRLGLGIDFKGDGGFVVAPPSIHDSGQSYAWINECEPAELPAWVVTQLRRSQAQPRLLVRSETAIPQGERNSTLASLAGSMRRPGFSPQAIEDALQTENQLRCDPPLAATEVAQIARSIGSYSPSRETRAHSWPAPLAAAAFYGVPGDFCRLVEPTTEADPAALLVQFLIGFGSLIGKSAYFVVEGQRHHTNEFALIVGATSKARKGTSWARVDTILQLVDPDWATGRVVGGVASGEGIIWAVRDSVRRKDEVIDEGVSDKRLLVLETEFSQLLSVASRDGSTVTEVIRRAWDGTVLQTLSKTNAARSALAHVSMVGHITVEELRRLLTTTAMANGFANRILPICAERSKLLPNGGQIDASAIRPLADRLRSAVAFAKTAGEMRRDDAANSLWVKAYEELSESPPGLFGSLTSRGEAHVLRLSMLFALLDSTDIIRVEHLQAAIAVWRYADASVRFIFGDAVGDVLADELLKALRARQSVGMTRTEIRDLFTRNRRHAEINRALGLLEERGLARKEPGESDGPGRPPERWFAANSATTETTKTTKDS
jgi:hypothetical protein